MEESDSVKLLWDFSIVTYRTTHANRPDLIVVLKEQRLAYLVDFSCPFDSNMTQKEAEKVEKYQDLLLEIQRMWHVKAEIIPVVIGTLGAVSSKFSDWLKRLHISLYPDAVIVPEFCVFLSVFIIQPNAKDNKKCDKNYIIKE